MRAVEAEFSVEQLHQVDDRLAPVELLPLLRGEACQHRLSDVSTWDIGVALEAGDVAPAWLAGAVVAPVAAGTAADPCAGGAAADAA